MPIGLFAVLDPSSPEPAPTPRPGGPEASLVQTFIVEDSPIILERLVATLEEMACVRVVGHAPDETAALLALQRLPHPVDLVIVDLFLRSGSGLGILRGAGNRAATCVVLTNYATPDMRQACLALGADRVFDKSKDLDELILYCQALAQRGGEGAAAPA